MDHVIVWGLIGTGNVTEVKSGPGLYKSKNSVLKGVYNRTSSKAEEWINRHGVGKVYYSIDEILEDKEIDIIYIATPPNTHKEMVLKVLKAGKIPYVEKPMALNHEECKEMKKASDELGIPIYVAFYRRGMEKYIKIKEILDTGLLGNILSVHVTHLLPVEKNELDPAHLPWRVKYEITRGGKFLDMGVHVLDILTFFFGNIKQIYGFAKNNGKYYDVDDTVTASFEFENGTIGTGNWCYVSDRTVDELIIYGSKGKLTTEGLGYGDVILETQSETKTMHFVQPKHVAMPYQQSIVDELLGIKKSNANLNNAINVTESTDRILYEYNKKFKEFNKNDNTNII